MAGKRFRIAFILLVFTGVTVCASRMVNPLSRSLHEYCADYLLRHPIGCYRVDSMSGMGETHYTCKVCRGLRVYHHENSYDYDDYYNHMMTWDRILNSMLVKQVPTTDRSLQRETIVEKSLSKEIVKEDASHTDKEMYTRYVMAENLHSKEAKAANVNEISTKSEGSSPVTTERFLGKVPEIIKPAKEKTIEETEGTTANASDESVKDFTITKSTEEDRLETRLAENSTYDIRNTTTELLNDTKLEVLGVKEVIDGKYEGTTQIASTEENATESAKSNNENINSTSETEIGTEEEVTVSRESNGTTEEISETISTELETIKPDDVNNSTRESTIGALVTNVTAEDETVVFNLTAASEEITTAKYENGTTEIEGIRTERTTSKSEITIGGRVETTETENIADKEITTKVYPKKQEKPGISGTVTVQTLSTMEISGVKTLRLVVSVLFLAIGLIATVVLTIYMIKVKRRTVAYDQLKLLP